MILDRSLGSDPLGELRGGGQKIKIQLFKNMVMLNFKLNVIKKMQHHGSKYFARRPPSPDPGVESKGQNSFFSKHGHVTYQIKGDHEMQ